VDHAAPHHGNEGHVGTGDDVIGLTVDLDQKTNEMKWSEHDGKGKIF
jgi:hypothetical protein